MTQLLAHVLALFTLVARADGACTFGPPIVGVDVTDNGAYTEGVTGIAAAKTVVYSTMVCGHVSHSLADVGRLRQPVHGRCDVHGVRGHQPHVLFHHVLHGEGGAADGRRRHPAALLVALLVLPETVRQRQGTSRSQSHFAVVPASTQTCAYALKSSTAVHPAASVADLSADKLICENQCKMSE